MSFPILLFCIALISVTRAERAQRGDRHRAHLLDHAGPASSAARCSSARARSSWSPPARWACSHWRIMRKHLFPHLVPTIIVVSHPGRRLLDPDRGLAVVPRRRRPGAGPLRGDDRAGQGVLPDRALAAVRAPASAWMLTVLAFNLAGDGCVTSSTRPHLSAADDPVLLRRIPQARRRPVRRGHPRLPADPRGARRPGPAASPDPTPAPTRSHHPPPTRTRPQHLATSTGNTCVGLLHGDLGTSFALAEHLGALGDPERAAISAALPMLGVLWEAVLGSPGRDPGAAYRPGKVCRPAHHARHAGRPLRAAVLGGPAALLYVLAYTSQPLPVERGYASAVHQLFDSAVFHPRPGRRRLARTGSPAPTCWRHCAASTCRPPRAKGMPEGSCWSWGTATATC